MIEIIEILRQEHRNMEKMLGVLEQELAVFARGDRPDYEIVLAVIEYFTGYPDSCHHPKEDIIVEKFKARDSVAAARIGNLEAQHRDGAKRLRRVAEAIKYVLTDQDIVRKVIEEVIRDFIEREREHMAMEERVLFPALLDALRPEDWADIALKLADRYSSPSEPDFEQKFGTLRRSILKIEDAA